jgi:hypothetical protein
MDRHDYKDRHDYIRRASQFPERIQRIAADNPLINRIVQEYAVGNILTFDEALCQMVVLLAKNWDKERQAYLEVIRMHASPLAVFKH